MKILLKTLLIVLLCTACQSDKDYTVQIEYNDNLGGFTTPVKNEKPIKAPNDSAAFAMGALHYFSYQKVISDNNTSYSDLRFKVKDEHGSDISYNLSDTKKAEIISFIKTQFK